MKRHSCLLRCSVCPNEVYEPLFISNPSVCLLKENQVTVRLFLLFFCVCSVLTVAVCLQVSDRQSYLVVSLVLCLLLGLLLCLQCCRRPSSSPDTNNGTLPKSNHYPSPKRFVVDPHTYQQDVSVPSCLILSLVLALILFSSVDASPPTMT